MSTPLSTDTARLRALMVAIKSPEQNEDTCNELLDELAELCTTMGVDVVDRVVVRGDKPKSRFLIGTGNADMIIQRCREQDVKVIVFDDTLSPSQQRNWERASKISVIDRQEVILDIFGARASTREASLQIELARSEYELPRLKRAWTHLSRQQGGVGVRGGEGEKQIEVDARMVRNRVHKLKTQLAHVRKQRAEQRKKRRQLPVPNAAIVGYTNAGKSSLLNRLTNAEALVEDKLFATLDPTTRRLELENNQTILLTDTVGFIRKLPHGLIESFKATLEEAVLADFLVHVIDATSPHIEHHMRTTEEVLAEIGAGDKYMVTVFNKVDKIEEPYILSRLKRHYPGAFLISVHTGEGLDGLIAELALMLEKKMRQMALQIPVNRYDVVAAVHRSCSVISEEFEDDRVLISAIVPDTCRHDFAAYEIGEAEGAKDHSASRPHALDPHNA